MRYIYPALFKQLNNNIYYVNIPDLPGCQTEGYGILDAIDMAKDAIMMWLQDEEIAPSSTSITQIELGKADFKLLIAINELDIKHFNHSYEKPLL